MKTSLAHNSHKSSTITSDNFWRKSLLLKPRHRLILNYILLFYNFGNRAYPTAETIAKYFGVSGRTIYRALKYLRENDWLIRDGTSPRRTKYYYLNPLFFDARQRRNLSLIFPACKTILTEATLTELANEPEWKKHVYKNMSDKYYIRDYTTNKQASLLYTVNRSNARGEADGKSLLAFKMKDENMNEKNFPWTIDDNPQISKVVIGLTWELKLSKRGQIELAAFPADILRDAYRSLKKQAAKRTIENPYVYLLSVCRRKCEESGVSPDKKARQYLFQTYYLSEYDHPTIEAFFEEHATQSDYEVDSSEFESSTNTKKGGGRKSKPYESPDERQHTSEELENAAQHFFKYQYAITWFSEVEGKNYLLPWVSLSWRVHKSSPQTEKVFQAKRKQRLLSEDTSLFAINERVKKTYIKADTLQQKTLSLEEIKRKIWDATRPPVQKTQEEMMQSDFVPSTADWNSMADSMLETYDQLKAKMDSDEVIYKRQAANKTKQVSSPQENIPEDDDNQFSDAETGFQYKDSMKQNRSRKGQYDLGLDREQKFSMLDKLTELKKRVDFSRLPESMITYIESVQFQRVLSSYTIDQLVDLLQKSVK